MRKCEQTQCKDISPKGKLCWVCRFLRESSNLTSPMHTGHVRIRRCFMYLTRSQIWFTVVEKAKIMRGKMIINEKAELEELRFPCFSSNLELWLSPNQIWWRRTSAARSWSSQVTEESSQVTKESFLRTIYEEDSDDGEDTLEVLSWTGCSNDSERPDSRRIATFWEGYMVEFVNILH